MEATTDFYPDRGILTPSAASQVARTAFASALSSAWGREAGEPLVVLRKLPGVLGCESGGARMITADDERGDLDNLAFASRGCAGLFLSAGDMVVCCDAVAATGR
jgi:hypothetical protein